MIQPASNDGTAARIGIGRMSRTSRFVAAHGISPKIGTFFVRSGLRRAVAISVSVVLLFALSSGASANAAGFSAQKYSAQAPAYDQILLARVALNIEKYQDTVDSKGVWGPCEAAGFGVFEHITVDHKRWWNSKAGKKSRIRASFMRTKGYHRFCTWLSRDGSGSLQQAYDGTMTVYWSLWNVAAMKDLPGILHKARCELAWSAAFSALDSVGAAALAPFSKPSSEMKDFIRHMVMESLDYNAEC